MSNRQPVLHKADRAEVGHGLSESPGNEGNVMPRRSGLLTNIYLGKQTLFEVYANLKL